MSLSDSSSNIKFKSLVSCSRNSRSSTEAPLAVIRVHMSSLCPKRDRDRDRQGHTCFLYPFLAFPFPCGTFSPSSSLSASTFAEGPTPDVEANPSSMCDAAGPLEVSLDGRFFIFLSGTNRPFFLLAVTTLTVVLRFIDAWADILAGVFDALLHMMRDRRDRRNAAFHQRY